MSQSEVILLGTCCVTALVRSEHYSTENILNMKKNLKDYIHLYIGCFVKYPNTEGKLITAKLTGVSRGDGIETTYKRKRDNCSGDYISWEPNGYHDCNGQNVKLLLRPLSDMTPDERFYAQFNAQCYFLENDNKHPIDYYLPNAEQAAIVTHYLLSKGFDLFGLIDEGLAIATTLPNKEQNDELSVASKAKSR